MTRARHIIVFIIPALLLLAVMLGSPLFVRADQPAFPAALPGATSTGGPLRPQIVGGEEVTDMSDIPWQIALLQNNSQICGGTIVAQRWIITAAHCVSSGGSTTPASMLKILAGSRSLSPYDSGYQRIQVSSVTVHPNYNENTTNNDIALLRLSTELTYTDQVQPLTLIDSATATYAGSGAAALVSGWGDQAVDEPENPLALRRVIVPITSDAVCQAAYPNQITAGMFCAGYLAGGKDSCQGDSGGPLAVPVADGWRLAGIVSWGTGCALPNYPGVYTRVLQYRSWIESKIAELVPTVGPSPTTAATATIGPTMTVAPTITPTPLPPTAIPQLNTVQNSGFEAAPQVGWSEQSGSVATLIYADGTAGTRPPFAGSQAAWLGGVDDEVAVLSQSLFSGAVGGLLHYRYRILSDEACGPEYDTARLSVEIIGPAPSGGPAAAAAQDLVKLELCVDNVADSWRKVTVSLHDYASAQLKIAFSVETDYSYASSLFVDDVIFEPFVQRLLVPAVAR